GPADRERSLQKVASAEKISVQSSKSERNAIAAATLTP
ncbi:MAG: hypothetical protein ACI9MX_003740, partial [Candidatus Aldehydirespiratoraceae bacterium]